MPEASTLRSRSHPQCDAQQQQDSKQRKPGRLRCHTPIFSRLLELAGPNRGVRFRNSAAACHTKSISGAHDLRFVACGGAWIAICEVESDCKGKLPAGLELPLSLQTCHLPVSCWYRRCLISDRCKVGPGTARPVADAVIEACCGDTGGQSAARILVFDSGWVCTPK